MKLSYKFKDKFLVDQLGRASFSVPLNIAEGSGKFSKADRKNYFTTSRASLFECVAIIDILKDAEKLTEFELEKMLKDADELSRILYAMIKNLSWFSWTKLLLRLLKAQKISTIKRFKIIHSIDLYYFMLEIVRVSLLGTSG